MKKEKEIRVRFAPSPTGFLHMGGLRMALYDYLFAKKHGGKFVLRIEDTDQKRFVEGALENALSLLNEFDLTYDEGPVLLKEKGEEKGMLSSNYPGIYEKGSSGPYIQSERLPLYRKEAMELIEKGATYYCFCTAERLTALRQKQSQEKKPPRYDGTCRHLSRETRERQLKEGLPYVIRLAVPEKRGEIIFHDLVRGEVKIDASEVDDQVLVKSDGFPTYHLAVVVDDHHMHITHVIRGEEWLSSTPKHLLLYEAFGWGIPFFAHLPLLLDPSKKKLSKRKGDKSVDGFLERGYLKEAILNFVALLGWNPGQGETQEIFSLEELVQKFSLENVNISGAVFDTQKLDWMNHLYIMKKTPKDLVHLIRKGKFLEKKEFYQKAPLLAQTDTYLEKVLTIEQERLVTLFEVGEKNQFFFTETLKYPPSLLVWKENSPEATREALKQAEKTFMEIKDDDWTQENLKRILLKGAGEKRGDFLWPLRVALTGIERSPSPMDVAWVLGKEESLRRVQKALVLL